MAISHSISDSVRRAIGFTDSWEEEEINPVTGEYRTVIRRKHYPPDVSAIKFHLRLKTSGVRRRISRSRPSADPVRRSWRASMSDWPRCVSRVI